MLDTRGHIATWNSGAAILKGCTATEIIGQHFSAFYGCDDCAIEKPARELEVCLREGKAEDEGWRYRKKLGPGSWPTRWSPLSTRTIAVWDSSK
ncbi:CheY-like superfamily [Penicillium chrysogenum]|uniref:CheY-like superfamily n=1 Tax=Penicillium chrysogenum TaxID=5076 RepID=A0ABQ8WZ47_PENCH|nr:CheY-like superfamily [Penicillium chrysogenum]